MLEQGIGDESDLRFRIVHQSLSGTTQAVDLKTEREFRIVGLQITTRHAQIDSVAVVGDRTAEHFLGSRTGQTHCHQMLDREVTRLFVAAT
jgi:hypothetical protein